MFHAPVDHGRSNLILVFLQAVMIQSLPEPSHYDPTVVQPYNVVLRPQLHTVNTMLDSRLFQSCLEPVEVEVYKRFHTRESLLREGGGQGIGNVLEGMTPPGPLHVYHQEGLPSPLI